MKLNRSVSPSGKRFAVIGHPLGHTFSPMIHNTAMQMLGVDGIYIPMPVSTELLPETVRVLCESFDGFNVTIPHKAAIVPLLDLLDDSALRMGGVVNTVRVVDGRLMGYNTDGIGFLQALYAKGYTVKDKRVLVLGAGGVARAICASLLGAGSKQVAVWARSRDKLMEFVGRMESMGQVQPLVELGNDAFDVVVNATSVGMLPDTNSTPFVKELFESVEIAYDVVYNPIETRFLREAKEMGCARWRWV